MNQRPVRRVGDSVIVATAHVRDFLATPAGRRLRDLVATGLIVMTPLLLRSRALRRSPLIRAIEALGGAALVIRLAEAIRDWEREGEREETIVLDVPAVDSGAN
jgi:hypothetical protein